MRGGRSWYQVLQVDPQAEPEIIEATYRRLAKKYHPDVATSRDAGERMKEINAAYAVLRDPLQRMAYDRELLERSASVQRGVVVEPADEEAPEADAAPVADGILACLLHGSAAAVGTCGDCDVGLCAACFDRFQPPSCPSCVVSWVRQRRLEILVPAIWFFGVLGLAGWICLQDVSPLPAPRVVPPAWLGWLLLGAYVVASFPSGLRALGGMEELGQDDGRGIGWILLLATGLGLIIAPFRMLKVFWDLRQVRRLETLARSAD
jgi:hypothetical protein